LTETDKASGKELLVFKNGWNRTGTWLLKRKAALFFINNKNTRYAVEMALIVIS
jgi:hypothetical protein